MNRVAAIFKRKRSVKFYASVLLAVLFLLLLLICLFGNENAGKSFQDFKYPSEFNFHELLNLKNISSIPILNHYKPKLINKIKIKNFKDIKVVIFVKSSIHNSLHRLKIRETWGSRACRRSHNIQLYFVLGQTLDLNGNNVLIDEDINIESVKYQDILRFNFIDVYFNNTLKVMSILDHFVKFHLDSPYMLIIDDDFFVDPSQLTYFINFQISKFQYDTFFGGYVWYHNVPQRNPFSKWHVTREQYEFDYYPPYAIGGFILMSSPMAKRCDKLLPYLKYNPIDDVLLGILLFKLNIYPSKIKNVFTTRLDNMPIDILACHEMSNDLITFWQKNNFKSKC